MIVSYEIVGIFLRNCAVEICEEDELYNTSITPGCIPKPFIFTFGFVFMAGRSAKVFCTPIVSEFAYFLNERRPKGVGNDAVAS